MSGSEPWIQTFSGRVFPLKTFDPGAILIEDIAHALGMLCRFNGQCQRFYSVAEHSVHVSHEVKPDLALLGLMHDTAEAYLGDVPTPLKQDLPAYHEAEEQLISLIANKFRFTWPAEGSSEEEELKRADLQLLVDEKTKIMVMEPKPWFDQQIAAKDPDRIQCWAPDEAKNMFLKRFQELMC